VQTNASLLTEGPVLVCGATGELGGRIARRLRAAGVAVRALVRPGSPAEALRALDIDVVSGDFRDRASLDRATVGVRAVVSTVTVIARIFAGEKGANFNDVDVSGHRHLIAAAEVAGVERFLFVSATSMRFPEAAKTPLGEGKISTERALSGSHLREVIVRQIGRAHV